MSAMPSEGSTLGSLAEFDRPADRIRHHRQASDAPVLVVEGIDDWLVLRDHLSGIDIFHVGGKRNVLDAVGQLIAWAIETVYCVVDRDFDEESIPPDVATVCTYYAGADLEGMLIDLGALKTVLDHQGSYDKMTAVGGSSSLVQRLKASVTPITRLRRLNASEGWGLSFDHVDIASHVDRTTLELRVPNYCRALLQASTSSAQFRELSAGALDESTIPSEHRGKDVVTIAGVALRKVAGSLQLAACTEAVLTPQVHSSCALVLADSDWLAELRGRLQLAAG